MTDYPHRWRRVARGGYGYVELVPCRILDKGRARWTIAALRADGTEAVRTVKPENVIDPGGYQPMLRGLVEVGSRCPGCGVVCASLDAEHLDGCEYQGRNAQWLRPASSDGAS